MADPTISAETFRMEEWPFYWLTRFTGAYLLRIEIGLKAIGLDVPQWRVLMVLRGADVMSVSEIADHAIVKLPTMTRIIQRMQMEGLLISNQSAHDGRVTEIRLTEAGQAAGKRAFAVAKRIYQRAFENVSEAEIATLNAVMRRMFHNVSDRPPPGHDQFVPAST